jgi:DNA processing protein
MLPNNFNPTALLKVHLLCYDNPKRAHSIVSTFESYDQFESMINDFITTTITQKRHQDLFRNRFNALHRQTRSLLEKKTSFITVQDPLYPLTLREIAYFPLVLFFSGSLSLASTPQIAVVGSRKNSDYGAQAINTLLPPLLPHFSITSGLADGIDTLAHQCALDRHAATIAVVGNGLDVIYPAKNANLYKKISKSGLILSEFPPGTPGLAHHFPQRNRIVSGLSKATLVIEASKKSGALITAHHALEQNRDVFAVPGPIGSQTSIGCHRLIQEGAKLVHSSNDILEEFQIKPSSKPSPPLDSAPPSSLSSHESAVITLLSATPHSFDYLVTTTQLPVQTVLQTLTLLEIKGLIVQHAGQQFSRILQ